MRGGRRIACVLAALLASGACVSSLPAPEPTADGGTRAHDASARDGLGPSPDALVRPTDAPHANGDARFEGATPPVDAGAPDATSASCPGGCGACESCTNGTCQSTCGACETCSHGACASTCGACESCSGGTCVSGCGACETCSGGACVSTCGACESCNNGQCASTCMGCQTCTNGACQTTSPCGASNCGVDGCGTSCGTCTSEFTCLCDNLTVECASGQAGTCAHCCAKCSNRSGTYHASANGESCAAAAATFCSINDRGSVQSATEGTCPEAPTGS